MGGWIALSAQVPLTADRIAERGAIEQIELKWRVDAGVRALESGLASLAETIFRSVLENAPELSDSELDELNISLAKSLIAQKRFVAARAQLEGAPELERSSRYMLYLAIAIYGEGGARIDVDAFRAVLGSVKVKELSSGDVPWNSLLNGLEAELDGNLDLATKAFERAASEAGSPMLRTHFESLVMRQNLLLGEADEALAAELGAKLNKFQGEAAAYPFVREYAVVLYRLGRSTEAIGALDRELANTAAGYSIGEREQLRLLKGLILGADTVTGRAALKELIRNGKNRTAMGIALQLLARSPERDDDLLQFLNVMVTRTERHPLLGQMLYLRSQLALKSPDLMTVAVDDAKTLLDQFPGFGEITSVYRLLAYASLKRYPPQYRAAADFLVQLRDQSKKAEDLVELNRLIGDCYFLNGDFANAVDFYEAARNRDLSPAYEGVLFLRLISAQVRAGEIEDALQLIDEADFSGNVALTDRWQAEWNVAQAMQAAGDIKRAVERVRSLLGEAASGVPAALDLRLCWLEAFLSLEMKEFDGLVDRVSRLLSRLDSMPEGALNAEDVLLLKTEILLLRGNVLIRSGDANAGMLELSELRDTFAETAAAQRSYLVEASYHGLVGDYSAAQTTLTALAERYGYSPLAPQALFEAALYCERRGAEFYPQALFLHNDLAERYASDPLYYSSRLKQGNLLRSMNDFPGAQTIYENLINQSPSHPMRYIAELSRADCMLALSSNESGELGDVIAALERLLDLPNLPLDFQTEAAYKWAFALMKNGANEKAKEVLSLSVARFLPAGSQAVELGASGRYWVARSMLKLGEMLESEESLQEARNLYRQLVAYGLPGRNIAISRADRLINIE